MSCLSYFDGFIDGRLVAVQLFFVECCFQDLFDIAHSILVQFPTNFFSIRLVVGKERMILKEL